MLNIQKTIQGSQAVLALEGRMETTTAPDLAQAVQALPPTVTDLTLDFQKLDYISSFGLRVLMTAHRLMTARGSLRIRNVNKEILYIFAITGFSDVLTIE